jgi:hypothetical protein
VFKRWPHQLEKSENVAPTKQQHTGMVRAYGGTQSLNCIDRNMDLEPTNACKPSSNTKSLQLQMASGQWLGLLTFMCVKKLVVADNNPEYVLLEIHFVHLAITLSPSKLTTLKNVPSNITGTLLVLEIELVSVAIL